MISQIQCVDRFWKETAPRKEPESAILKGMLVIKNSKMT